MSHELTDLLIDIRDRVIRIETRIEVLPELEKEVKKQGEEILKAKTSMKTLRWLSGMLLITLPASVAAVVRVMKG